MAAVEERKPLERRLEEAMNIYKGLKDNGVDPAKDAPSEFREAVARYVRTGRGESGVLPLVGTEAFAGGPKLVFELTPNARRESGVTIRRGGATTKR